MSLTDPLLMDRVCIRLYRVDILTTGCGAVSASVAGLHGSGRECCTLKFAEGVSGEISSDLRHDSRMWLWQCGG